ncbi:MAG TPA: hypothetical protein VJT16_26275 [Streptosporangiaceae bacterium]|nr:hypothetical protein [Streptosporangiaceae bacterium]
MGFRYRPHGALSTSRGPERATKGPAYDGCWRQALIPRFEADVRLLESLTGDDFSDWLAPRGDSGGLVGARPAGQQQARNARPREY